MEGTWSREILLCDRCDELADACKCPLHLQHLVAVRIVKIPTGQPQGKPVCANCGTKVMGEGRPYWEEIVGWTQRRAQGGANHVADRTPTGRFLCEPCMHLQRSPVAEQRGMF